MAKVTKESLEERIQHLKDLGSMLTLNEEYQLSAYKMLLDYMRAEEYEQENWEEEQWRGL